MGISHVLGGRILGAALVTEDHLGNKHVVMFDDCKTASIEVNENASDGLRFPGDGGPPELLPSMRGSMTVDATRVKIWMAGETEQSDNVPRGIYLPDMSFKAIDVESDPVDD